MTTPFLGRRNRLFNFEKWWVMMKLVGEMSRVIWWYVSFLALKRKDVKGFKYLFSLIFEGKIRPYKYLGGIC